ncbi:MAG: TrkH family potassium uptake protein, partial [Eudoraea sp.]|nr:TrkH family potassium uptake protein [Eudoraea sp.]
MGFNAKIILHLMGLLLLCNGGFMLLAALVSGIYHDGVTLEITLAAIVTMMLGVMAMFL